ncbi:hypothetical protein [Vibrio cyclitrophicus]|uniref:hypothetical protein n=1 Tax=Vibrio cyclitrophicus TaxID=47951 RepID=UPI00037CC5A9|nr:hypothetical protein [Vibrio cyclitrophicus]OEF27347.1 hypothetical protein OA9_14375 [Vibrio cyclitrophicus 1F97]
MTPKQQAQQLYCELHPHTQNKVKLITAILQGKTPNQIVTERCTNLSIATIYATYQALIKLINNKETK